MLEPTDYRGKASILASRRQAWRVWAVGAGVLLIWLLTMIVAPAAHASGADYISSGIYQFFGLICHQIPERSLHLLGNPMAVCSRCLGVYFGLFAGFAVYPLWRSIAEAEPPRRIWLFAALIPIAIDWSLTVLGVWDNTHVSRLLTGLTLGFACATFIFPALVETIRNVTRRRPESASHAPTNLY